MLISSKRHSSFDGSTLKVKELTNDKLINTNRTRAVWVCTPIFRKISRPVRELEKCLPLYFRFIELCRSVEICCNFPNNPESFMFC